MEHKYLIEEMKYHALIFKVQCGNCQEFMEFELTVIDLLEMNNCNEQIHYLACNCGENCTIRISKLKEE